ncbi:SRPBCC family protein [Klenkia brasiliensis]|uniref:Polyketide cyclase / dehydrase and lipid transport n=1 Tax=Klenkia brasiliensis TaxID=333142 RepID=A0A1G7ZB07_9ACTN|nr:SRPBCC family protein [Klenkia brasiliensis]SDH05795.1 Polyketide cyclase / dehydrase and lipid transport [Klenkia brasiliensis]
MPDTYAVTRQVTIAAPAAAVHALLADFRRWRAWSPFEDLDPDMSREYDGTGAGSAYRWAGSFKAGSGSMRMTDVASARVVVEQQNTKPIRSSSTSTFTLAEADGATTVTWSGSGRQGRLMRLLPMEKFLGPTFDKGLAQLKAAAEQG